MRIEKLELTGFKSFADKTTFVLHPGITCIVGPNGCGKSNVVDAFRWVLGEQSAKSLRGEKMEEVICGGSLSKKPKGMAEVAMIISGLNGGGNGQGDDVTITRRLYRSGESEYMLNKNQCRLRDIKDLFLDTGLEVRSYSILEQGRIGEILNSKPLERRFIIEEVAGVMKYKVRKAEALSKLESSRLNLARVTDIIAEVRKQINILDRLARKAERYKKLSSEMHAIELKIARKEYQRIKESYGRILEELKAMREKEAFQRAEITSIENTTEARRVELLEKEKELELVQKNYQAMERDISGIESAIAIAKNDISNIAEYQEKIIQQEEEADSRIAEISARCEELRGSSSRLSEEMEADIEVLREKTEFLGAIEETLSEKEELIEDKRKEIFRITEELSNLRNDLNRQQSSLESLEKREDSAVRESEDSRKILTEIESSINSLELEIHGRTNEVLLLKEKKDVLAQELYDAKNWLESLVVLLSGAREDIASYTSRLDSLKEMVFDSPTRDLLASNENIRLLASISEVMEVDAEFEKAIESALAEKTDSFILDSAASIEIAVSALKGKEAGRTAFITPAPPRISSSINVPEGVIGRAPDFVVVKEEYSGIAENLLGAVLIVKDIRTAFDLRALDGSYTFATLDGEVIEPSGSVIAGEGKGIFKRKREIKELEEVIQGKKAVIENTNREIQSLQDVIPGKEEDIRNVESSIINIEKEISLSRLTIENYIGDKERISRKLAYLTLEIEEVLREKGSIREHIFNNENQIQLVESKKIEIDNETSGLQEGIARKKAELEQYRAEATDIKLLTASNREKIEAMKNEIESSVVILDGLERKKDNLHAEKESVLARISQREAGISENEAKLRKLVADADLIGSDISGKKEGIEKENEDLIEVEHGLRTLRRQMTEVTARISDLDVMRAEHKLKLDNLSENVSNNYGTEIEDVELTEVMQGEEERLVELRKKIQEMGPVNLGTLEEYEELSVRYNFMNEQHDDLKKSIVELEEAISKINNTTRKKLREAFEALNAKFGEVFIILFGGGRAELVLTEENNILEAGIDIVAQPPGKKLQNINLLSGGEKALTALSLQFASFLLKPTPLCILDEVDAPLDESNTVRFTEMMRDLSSETQFVVVTHNKTTMSVAQHLYGITMEEAGISKVISMQLAGA